MIVHASDPQSHFHAQRKSTAASVVRIISPARTRQSIRVHLLERDEVFFFVILSSYLSITYSVSGILIRLCLLSPDLDLSNPKTFHTDDFTVQSVH